MLQVNPKTNIYSNKHRYMKDKKEENQLINNSREIDNPIERIYGYNYDRYWRLVTRSLLETDTRVNPRAMGAPSQK